MSLSRAQKEEISKSWINTLEEIIYEHVGEIFRTGENAHTITWQVAEDGGRPIYGSIKFTLHKEDYDLESKIDEFEYFLEEKKEKEKLEKERAVKKEKEREQRAIKAAKRKEQEEKEKKKRQEYLASLKENNTKE